MKLKLLLVTLGAVALFVAANETGEMLFAVGALFLITAALLWPKRSGK